MTTAHWKTIVKRGRPLKDNPRPALCCSRCRNFITAPVVLCGQGHALDATKCGAFRDASRTFQKLGI
jgi:hypothetical protein